MKKKSSFMVLFGLLFLGTFVQASFRYGQEMATAALLTGGSLVDIVTIVIKTVGTQLKKNQELNDSYEKTPSLYKDKSEFIKSEFPEKIEERIDAIIGQKSERLRSVTVSMFPTPKSKIFVLQNIQDFFEFQQDDKFKNLNLMVYEICTKRINELEKKTLYNLDNTIDGFLDDYKKQFGISTLTLKNMSAEEVDKKINEVTLIMDQLKAKGNGVKLMALIPILTHLYYKQSEKQKMFVEEEAEKADVLEQDLKQKLAARKKTFEEIIKGRAASQITGVASEAAEAKRKALLQQYPAMELLSIEEAKAAQKQSEEEKEQKKEARFWEQQEKEIRLDETKRYEQLGAKTWQEEVERREQLEKKIQQEEADLWNKEEEEIEEMKQDPDIKPESLPKRLEDFQKIREQRKLQLESKKEQRKLQLKREEEQRKLQFENRIQSLLKIRKASRDFLREEEVRQKREEEVRQKREEEVRQKREEAKRQPILSKMRSLWNSWWYGTK